MQLPAKFSLLILLLLITSCAFHPVAVNHYDADCQIHYKQFVVKQNGLYFQVQSCRNEGCIAALLFVPLQAIVVGSMVVAGNVVFWLEKEGECLVKDV